MEIENQKRFLNSNEFTNEFTHDELIDLGTILNAMLLDTLMPDSDGNSRVTRKTAEDNREMVTRLQHCIHETLEDHDYSQPI